MSSTTPTTSSPATRSRLQRRALGVLLAVLAPVVIWVIAVPVAGVSLEVSQGAGKEPMEVGLPAVIFTALLASLLGWGLLALLERFTARGTRIWTIVAAVVMVLSLVGPATADTSGSAKLVLALMHLAVGLTLIPMLSRAARS